VNPEVLSAPGLQLTAGGSLVTLSGFGLGADMPPSEILAGSLSSDLAEPFGPYGLANQWQKLASWGRALGAPTIPHGTVFLSPYFINLGSLGGILASDRASVLAGGYFDLTSANGNAGDTLGAVSFTMNQRATASTSFPDFYLTYGRSRLTLTGTILSGSSVLSASTVDGLQLGLQVDGAGIPSGTRIVEIDSINNRLVLSALSTATTTGTFSFSKTGALVASDSGVFLNNTVVSSLDSSAIQERQTVSLASGSLLIIRNIVDPVSGGSISVPSYNNNPFMTSLLGNSNVRVRSVSSGSLVFETNPPVGPGALLTAGTSMSTGTLTFTFSVANNLMFNVNGNVFGPYTMVAGSTLATRASGSYLALSQPAQKSSKSVRVLLDGKSYGPVEVIKGSQALLWRGSDFVRAGMPVRGPGILQGTTILKVSPPLSNGSLTLTLSAPATSELAANSKFDLEVGGGVAQDQPAQAHQRKIGVVKAEAAARGADHPHDRARLEPQPPSEMLHQQGRREDREHDPQMPHRDR
jgi:hypothetical protein